ncbi:hypothetical protein D3C71_2151550 [compost metagenome]
MDDSDEFPEVIRAVLNRTYIKNNFSGLRVHTFIFNRSRVPPRPYINGNAVIINLAG